MMLRFTLTGTCNDCGHHIAGVRCSFTERINLTNIRIKSSIGAVRPCEKCGCDVWPNDGRWTMHPEDEAAVEAVRVKLRARRKTKVAS